MWPARFPAGGGDELWLVAIVFEDDRRRIAVERSRLSAAEQRFADPEDDDCSHHRAGEGPTVVLGERERQFPLLYGVSATGARVSGAGRNHRAGKAAAAARACAADPLWIDDVRPCAGPRMCLKERGGSRSRPQ